MAKNPLSGRMVVPFLSVPDKLVEFAHSFLVSCNHYWRLHTVAVIILEPGATQADIDDLNRVLNGDDHAVKGTILWNPPVGRLLKS